MGAAIPAGAFEYAGVWRGTFSGNDSGTWEARVDTEGNITGSGTSQLAGSYLFSGWVSETGEFNAVATGPVSTGAEYQGNARRDGTVSGTWVNAGARMQGTFGGRRTSDVALEPDCHHQFRAGVPVPVGYGAAYDLFRDGRPLSIRVSDCSSQDAVLTVGRGGMPLQYVYRLGYEWRGDHWRPFSLNGARFVGDWIVGTAHALLRGSPAELSGLNYIAAHVCTWTGTEWKCGCRNATCTTSHWQLQAFRRR